MTATPTNVTGSRTTAPTNATASSRTWEETRRRLIPAMVIGSTLEWYDMFLYAQASALIFSGLFFPSFSPTAGTIAAFATFGVGYASRPLGAVVFGHIGDRYGRRTALMATLVLMGVATALIGCLPTHASIGIAAPILLVVLRLLQGLAAGAEFAGSLVMVAEAAPTARRGYFASLPGIGVYLGIILASGAGALAFKLDHHAALTWAWRLPFLFSIVLVVAGIYLRSRVAESPVFAELEREQQRNRMPIVEVLKGAKKRLVLSIIITAPVTMTATVVLAYSLSYSANHGTSQSTVLLGSLLGAAGGVLTVPLAGALSDRVGRKPVYLALVVASGIWPFIFFMLLSNGHVWAVLFAHVMVAPTAWAMTGGQAAYLTELFPAGYRYSGVALAREVCNAAFSAPLPVVAVALTSLAGGSPWLVAGLLAVAAVAAFAALLALPETRGSDLSAQ